MANPKWAAALNPVLANPLLGGKTLQNIALATGDNIVNHGLGAPLQGWFIVLRNSAAVIYDKQSTNPRPQLTLILNASAGATVSIYVF